MIRNDKEYRHSKERLSELEAELKELSSVRRSAGRAARWIKPAPTPLAITPE